MKTNAKEFQNFLTFHVILSPYIFEIFPVIILKGDTEMKNKTKPTATEKKKGRYSVSSWVVQQRIWSKENSCVFMELLH